VSSLGPEGLRGTRPTYRFLGMGLLSLVLLLVPHPALGQDVPNLAALENEYQAAQGEYQAAFFALQALENRYNQALEDWSVARSSQNQNRTDSIFTAVQRMGLQVGTQERRVQEKAGELEEARERLLNALGVRLEELIQERDSAVDPEEQRQLAAILADHTNRLLELRAEEPPELALEPMQEVTISPSDTPRDILRKAEFLSNRADRHEATLAEVDLRLRRLREDQRRARDVNDFVADLERYDDTRLPVVSPGARAVDPEPSQLPPGSDTLAVEDRPLTLEERIQQLEIFREDLTGRIESIRAKAGLFREIAGGGRI